MSRPHNCTRRPGIRAALAAAVLFANLLVSLSLSKGGPADAQAVTPLDYGAAPIDAARLGVAIAVAAELADTPDLLARPSSQAFLDGTFARIGAVTTDYGLRLQASRTRGDLFVTSGATFDRGRADRDLATLTRLLLANLPAPRDRICVVGILAQQSAYNARVLRSPSDDATLRKALGGAKAADGAVAGLAAMRARLATSAPGAWSDIATESAAIVTALLGPQNPLPFPETDAVWVVLLRSRFVAGETLRRGTPHVWLDIVRFDGTHRSIGAYPGDGDFAHDGRTLFCELGRENDVASEGAIPVTPPPGTTPAELAASLETRCAARPSPPLAYRVAAASDTRFVFDALLAAGVDASALLRESLAAMRAQPHR